MSIREALLTALVAPLAQESTKREAIHNAAEAHCDIMDSVLRTKHNPMGIPRNRGFQPVAANASITNQRNWGKLCRNCVETRGHSANNRLCVCANNTPSSNLGTIPRNMRYDEPTGLRQMEGPRYPYLGVVEQDLSMMPLSAEIEKSMNNAMRRYPEYAMEVMKWYDLALEARKVRLMISKGELSPCPENRHRADELARDAMKQRTEVLRIATLYQA